MNTTLRLSDVLGRGLVIEWFEAVALVLDVAERVRENLGGQEIPDLHQVELTADGRVSLSGATKTSEPVKRLGQLLQAALVQSDPPVQLRLVASQATAPVPSFSSIREYSEALAYFERPDRPAVLQRLYERAASVPAVDVALTPTLDELAPLEEFKPTNVKRPAPAVDNRAQKRKGAMLVIAAVTLVVGATAYRQFATAAPSGAQLSALAVKASDTVGTALVSGLSSVTDRAGLGRLASADATGRVPPAKPALAPTAKPPAVQKPKAPPLSEPQFRIFDLAPRVAADLSSPTLPAESVSVTLIATPEPEPDGTVYSASDPDVTAPIGVRPQLPAALPSDIKKEQLGQIELLILPDGSVGAVKLLGQPRSVLEGMLLSAAKTWKFRPAEKDGRPVAYRKLVWLVL